jgi:Mor family transcriptional regulator
MSQISLPKCAQDHQGLSLILKVARYFQKSVRITTLAREYRVSRNTVYNIINRSRVNRTRTIKDYP